MMASGPAYLRSTWESRQAVRASHGAVPIRTRLGKAHECLRLHAVESELGSETLCPFEVVEEAPDEIPPYVHSILECALDATQDLCQKGDSLRIVLRRDAALGYENRHSGNRRSAPPAQCSTPCGQYS